MEADYQYVDVEPTYKYTPTTVPAAEVPAPTPAPTQNQAPTQVTPTTPSNGNSSNNTYVPTTNRAPETTPYVTPSTQEVPRIEVKPAESVDRSTINVPTGNSNK